MTDEKSRNSEKSITAPAAAAFISSLIFLVFTCFVMYSPEVSSFDIEMIKRVQELLSGADDRIPAVCGGILFYLMSFAPVFTGAFLLIKNKKPQSAALYITAPFAAYFINSIIKVIVNRPRPPIELQIEEHMSSSSYISRHTFLTAALWGIFICIILKYCTNKPLKYFLIFISLCWILLEGFSRVWLGVHHPSDLLGALIFAVFFVIVYWCIPSKKYLSR